MRKLLLVVLLMFGLGASAPALADEESESYSERMEQLAREGVARFKESLERFIARIPRYGKPEMTPEGDIIVPRREAPDPHRSPGPPGKQDTLDQDQIDT